MQASSIYPHLNSSVLLLRSKAFCVVWFLWDDAEETLWIILVEPTCTVDETIQPYFLPRENDQSLLVLCTVILTKRNTEVVCKAK